MRPAARDLLLLLSLLAAAPVLAKSTDRDQPMDINADRSDSLLQDNGVSVLEGNVTIRQGTLEVDADRAEVHRRNGEIERIVLIGAPARLRQVSDTGEPMDARARQVVYTLSNENNQSPFPSSSHSSVSCAKSLPLPSLVKMYF